MIHIKRQILAATMVAGVLAASAGVAHAAGGAANVSLAAGSISLTGATPGDFSANLSGSDQTVSTTLSTYSVSDARGNAAGWHVTFQASSFSCTSVDSGCPVSGDTLPSGSLLMAPPTVACHSGTSCSGRASPPVISVSSNTALDTGTAVTVASAAAKEGMGTFDFTPGTIGGGNLQLTVPSYAYATTYHSTLTVSAISGP
ncbi:MAG: WxL domain-containing protein [Chloroflexota bacterium]